MFTNTALLRTCALRRELMNDIKRQISKTSTTSKSDAFTNPKNNTSSKSPANKWSRLNKHNNQRALSTLQAKIAPQASAVTVASKEESREFMAVFPDIVRDLTEAGKHTDIPEVTKWYTKVLQHNVPNGKKNRGLAVVAAYKMLEDPNNLTPENIRLANILGWCVEMIQAHFLIVDDIMDGSETRRGAPCWYKRDSVGLSAINDSLLIENGIYVLLKNYFSHLPLYVPAIELMRDITMKTCMGQALDSMCLVNGKPNLDVFTMKRYNDIVRYKTAYYTFHLPVALGMFLANKFDPEMHRQAKTILLELGQFFQIQDDFLDCFGNPSITGKVGTDIQEGKCSWLVVVALQRATPRQRQIIEKNYGVNDPAAINAIKSLYEELGLPNTYSIYEEETFNLIKTHIQQISKGLPHALFFKFLGKLYKRES